MLGSIVLLLYQGCIHPKSDAVTKSQCFPVCCLVVGSLLLLNTGIYFLFDNFFIYLDSGTKSRNVAKDTLFQRGPFYCCIGRSHAKKVVAGILDQPATMLTGDVQLPASVVVIATPGIKSKKRT